MSTDTHPSRAENQAVRLAEHRARAVAAIRDASALAAAHGARVRVFGSFAEGRFRPHSDLDLALDGPSEVLDRLAMAIEGAVAAHGIAVDVVRMDFAPPSLVGRVEEGWASRPIWHDVARDLARAAEQAAKAAEKHASLDAIADESAREDRELAIGKHLHDAVSAFERGLERIVAEVDGELPGGSRSHRDLLDRASRPFGERAAIMGPDSRRDVGRLIAFRHVFRHAYGAFDHALAAPNVFLAATALPRAAAELEAFAAAVGLRTEP